MSEDLKGRLEGAAQPPDLKTANGVKSFLSGSASEAEWNSRCDQVQAANGNKYPGFWYPTVIASGLSGETSAKWGGTDQIRVIPMKETPKAK